MRIRFIINPISGTGKQKGIEECISKYIKDFEIIYTNKAGDATRLSKEAVKENIDAVVAVGGDGTVNECLKGVVNTNTALGVIPCGSGNGFAYHIGMKRKIKEAIIQLRNTRIEKIDSCTVNGAPFVNVSGIGFDAHIADLFSDIKIRGFINYVKIILNELSYQPQKYMIKNNEIEREVSAYMISFANASQYGNDARISPMANIQDGLIDFVIVKDFPKWRIPLFLLKLITGKIHLSRYVEIIRCKQMQINTNKTLIHLDGEPYNTISPINIDLLSKSLKILIPKDEK